MTAGSVRGYSSWPAASQCRCQPAAADARRGAVAGAVARGVVPVQDGDRGDEQARAHARRGRRPPCAGRPSRCGSSPGEHVGLAAHRPVRHAVAARRAAPRPRPGCRRRWGGCAAGRCRRGPSCPRRRPRTRRSARRSTRPGCGPRRRRPPAAPSASPPPAGRGRCAASRRGTPRSGRAPRVDREPERHATPPSARSAGPITLASPTTTPVNAEGAKNRSAAAATSSGGDGRESRAGWLREPVERRGRRRPAR